MKNRVFTLLFIAALAGCNTGSVPAQSFVPSSPTSNSTAVPIAATGGTVIFPSANGYGGTFVYNANDAASGTTASAATIIDPTSALLPSGQTPPPGTMLVAFEFTLNQNVTFATWTRLLTTITIPSSVPTSGHTFSEYGYDLTAGVGEGWNPGTVSGSTIAFSSGGGPVTLLANHVYLIVLTTQ